MTKVLEIKNRMIRLAEEYDFYLGMLAKFLLAMWVFLVIRNNIGYMERLNNMMLLALLALICCLLPVNAIIWVSGLLTLLHLYALSRETAAVGLLLFVLVYLLYFRFVPRDGVIAILTPVAFHFQLPYALTIACGLLRGAYSFLAISCGTVLYYFLHGIHSNSSAILEMSASADAGIVDKLNLVLANVYGNKEMYLVLFVLALTTIMVYILRQVNVDHAWTMAIIAGSLIQLLGLFVGYMVLNVSNHTLWLLLGNIFGLAIGFLLQFLFMDLDYSRVERVQFEDDEYYYYVKAIPKKIITGEEKTISRFGNTGNMGNGKNTLTELIEEENQRREIARELEIDEEMLK